MPRYLVTLRHAETGETIGLNVWGGDQEDAVLRARDAANSEDDILNPSNDVWLPEYAEPADDPFRDR